MKVVLLKDLKGKGKKGDIISVNDGYASNYLIPNGFAKAGSATNLNEANQAKASIAYTEKLAFDNALKLEGELKNKEFTIKVKCGQNGKIFGSVTTKEISDELSNYKYDIDKKKIEIPNIKNIGLYTAKIKLHQKVTTEIKINVVAQV